MKQLVRMKPGLQTLPFLPKYYWAPSLGVSQVTECYTRARAAVANIRLIFQTVT